MSELQNILVTRNLRLTNVLIQSIAFVPRLLNNFQSQQKDGQRAWEQGYADFATLVHVTSNCETVGIDYGNRFSQHTCTCIMMYHVSDNSREAHVSEWVGEVCEWGGEWGTCNELNSCLLS